MSILHTDKDNIPANGGAPDKYTPEEKTVNISALLSNITAVNPDEAREIEQQIAEFTQKNTTHSLPSEKFKATKKEMAFPLLINLLVIGISVLVLLIISYSFSQQEQDVIGYTSGLSSVEGQLLREMQRVSQAQLSAKDQQIADTHKYLQKLEQDKNNTIRDLEQELQRREDEIGVLVAQDISNERDRLVMNGIPEEEITGMLTQFEQERTAAYQFELEELRLYTDKEQKTAEENFIRLQHQYQQNLTSLNTERESLQEQVRQQEQAIRAANEQQNAASQRLSEQAQEELEKAQRELAALNERRERSKMEDDRITGMYAAIRASLQEGRYTDAQRQAEELVKFFENTVSGMDETSGQRRSLDIFLASSLAQIARMELDRNNTSQAQYLMATETLEKQRMEAAQNLARAVSSIEQARLEAQRDNYAGAIDAYRQAASSLNFNEESTASLLASIEALNRLAVNRNTEMLNQENNAAAASLLARGNQEFARGQLRNAFDTYSQLVYSYPTAAQAPDAITGITRIFDAYVEQARAQAEARDQSGDITALTNRIFDLEAERDSLLQQNQNIQDFTVRLARLEAERDELLRRTQEQGQAAQQSNTLLAQFEVERDSLLRQTQEQEGALRALSARFAGLELERDELLRRNQAGGQNDQEITTLISRVDTLEAERIELLRRTQEQERVAQQSNTQLAQLEAERTSLLRQAQEQNRSIQDFTVRLAQLEAERNDLLQQNQTSEQKVQEITALISRVSSLEAERDSLFRQNQEQN
ncbi:MAG: hypothetical protein LBB43_05410, partial [Spirochaetaceae bacterium]|nr:hypothetical protein [Spirochaetaceae bacterium]